MLMNEVKELHASILEISKSSFEIKKLCITTIGIFNGFFLSKLQFSNNSQTIDLDLISTSILFTLLIAILFHITDATTYFFQRKNRERQSRFKQLLSIDNNTELFYLNKTNWISSFFNSSMIMYITIYLIALAALTYLKTSIETTMLSIIIFSLFIFITILSVKKKRKYS
ncbi:hypothetical protein WCT80_01675 [Pectobacterium carotovorum]